MSKGQLGNLQFFLFCYNNKNASCVSQRLEDPSGNKVSSVAQLQALMYMYSLELKTDTMDRSCGSWLERPLWAASGGAKPWSDLSSSQLSVGPTFPRPESGVLIHPSCPGADRRVLLGPWQ